MSARVAFQLSHSLGEPSLALAQADFGQLADRGAARAAMLAGVRVNTREQVVGQRDHDLCHEQSIPGNTRSGSGSDLATHPLERTGEDRSDVAAEQATHHVPSAPDSMMAPVIPAADLARLNKFCGARVPPEAREHVRAELEQERQAVNIVEYRPPWREDYGPEWSRMPIARLRYVASKDQWTLYYHRHTGRWERYPLLGPSRHLSDLLNEVAVDPICVFSG